jgi:hypothetical protein
MRPRHAVLTLLLAALALAGCGGEGQDSADDFRGAEQQVAEAVEDLQDAGRRGDPERICSELVTAGLARALAAGGASCEDEVQAAMRDISSFELEVADVTVTGATARAEVRGDEDDQRATVELAREGEGWRISGLRAG